LSEDIGNKILAKGNDRKSQWDIWAESHFDKTNRRHKSAKQQVDALTECLNEKEPDIEDVEYYIGMCETAFRKAPNPQNNEPPIMSRGKSVVTPRVKGIKMEIAAYATTAYEYMLAQFPGMLHLYRTSWSDSDETGGESYAVAGVSAGQLAKDLADSLADKASSQPFRAYHNNLHEGDTNVLVAVYDEDKEVDTFTTEDDLTLIKLTAFRNKPTKDGGES